MYVQGGPQKGKPLPIESSVNCIKAWQWLLVTVLTFFLCMFAPVRMLLLGFRFYYHFCIYLYIVMYDVRVKY